MNSICVRFNRVIQLDAVFHMEMRETTTMTQMSARKVLSLIPTYELALDGSETIAKRALLSFNAHKVHCVVSIQEIQCLPSFLFDRIDHSEFNATNYHVDSVVIGSLKEIIVKLNHWLAIAIEIDAIHKHSIEFFI